MVLLTVLETSYKYRKSSFKPSGTGGAYLFQTHGRGLIETGGLFNLADTMVSVLHKELDYKMDNLSKSWRSCTQGSKTNPNFQLVKKTSQISPREILQSWLINTVYHFISEE